MKHTFAFTITAAALLLASTAVQPVPAAEVACPALLKHTLAGIDGKPRNLCQYKGKVLLVVNTASRCGYTPQYEQLQSLHTRYQGRGFTVLGFPANNFANQEPGSNAEISKFCSENYKVSFPMFGKSPVLGEKANPLFRALRTATGQPPLWNFHKYLIDRSGKRVLSYDSSTKPLDSKLTKQIEQML